MTHQVDHVRSAEAAHYNRLYRRRSFSQKFQELQHQDAKVVERLRHQQGLSNKLRQFLAAAESREYDYKSRLCENDADAVSTPKLSSPSMASQSKELKQIKLSLHPSPSSLPRIDTYGHQATGQDDPGALGLRGGGLSPPPSTKVSDHSRKKYQRHHYTFTRLQKKLRASEQQVDALEERLSQIQWRTKLYRNAWWSEQDRVCNPVYCPPPASSCHQHPSATGRRDSGTWNSQNDTLAKLAIGAVQSAAMYGAAVDYSWHDLLAPQEPKSAWYESFQSPQQNAGNRSHRFSSDTVALGSDHDLDELGISFPHSFSLEDNMGYYTDHLIPPGHTSIPIYEQAHRPCSEPDDAIKTPDKLIRPDAEHQGQDGEQARMSSTAEENAKRQTAAQPVRKRYDEVATGSRSRRRLNRSYSTDDLENVRRYNDRHMPEWTA